MKIVTTKIDGVVMIKNRVFNDNRGIFCKTYNKDIFEKYNLCTEFKESYYSISRKNVIRGMHFQLPPFDHDKLVCVPKGKILDVILDLRKKSRTFGQYISAELSEYNRFSIYIPRGCAHGFKSYEDNTILINSTTTVYNPEYDTGIRWDSFGMDWKIKNPIISDKDNSLQYFSEFENPF
ncbi:MAG: dTDP-4-dehydrorhamnose 3,5-epimerase [Maledivibacter sp.]|jgi:dTDP-4-dehydrorhamnose 3,5-epimerase|nr:dTDP-4-dehydrorhamnose 3,5-epimerase [Maledivibacter sp.]